MAACFVLDGTNLVYSASYTELAMQNGDYSLCTSQTGEAIYVLPTAAEYVQSISPAVVDTGIIGQSFGWGFGVIVSCWALAYVIRVALGIVRKL